MSTEDPLAAADYDGDGDYDYVYDPPPERSDPDYDDSLPTPTEEDDSDNASEAESTLHERLAAGEAAAGAIDQHGHPVHGEDDGSEGVEVDDSDEPDAEETGPGPLGEDGEGIE